jgi:hypothetical protein
MAIDFPNSPSTNDQYTVGTTTWVYNGTAWVVALGDASIATAAITADKIASGAAVSNIGYTPANIAGPTFTGTVTLPSTTSIGTVSATEIGYVDGVTSAIQTQLDSKLTATTAVTSNRNAIINGAMQVAQRGTTFTGLVSFQYSLDRWKSFRLAGAPFNISQQATSDTTNLPNIQYCARVGRASSNTNLQLVFFSQSIESINSRAFAGKIVTVSFYARKGANYSAASDALKVEVNTGTGTDQDVINGFTGQASPINQTATLTTTWQRFTYTSTTLSSSMTQLAVNFYYTPVGTAGAADYFEITGVQLEAGAVATPFETEDYGTTLKKCERYYQKGYNDTTYAGNGGVVNGGFWTYTYAAVPNNIIYYSFLFPTRMRTAPTVYIYSYAGLQNRVHASGVGDLAANSAVPTQIGNAGCAIMNQQGSAITAGWVLLGYYTADSEL